MLALCLDPWPIWVAGPQPYPLVVLRGRRVVAVNREARRWGIRVGDSAHTVRSRDSGAVFLEERELPLAERWAEVLKDLGRHSPRVESLRPGRALLDLPLAEARLLVEGYRARGGYAPHAALAELAALSAWEGTLRTVREEADFLGRLPIYFLRGVGLTQASQERLERLGVGTAGALRGWGWARVRAFLDEAPKLRPYLFDPPRTRLFPAPEELSLALEGVYPEGALEPYQVEPLLARLAERLAVRLGGRRAGRIGVTAVAAGVVFSASRAPAIPLGEPEGIFRAAKALLLSSGAAGLTLERVRIELGGIGWALQQRPLWEGMGEPSAKERALSALLCHPGYAPHAVRAVWLDPYSLACERNVRYRPVAMEVEDAAGVAAR